MKPSSAPDPSPSSANPSPCYLQNQFGQPVRPASLLQLTQAIDSALGLDKPHPRRIKQTSDQLRELHTNDKLPNYRYRGILRLKKCYDCGKNVDDLCNCPYCGWQEDIALDLTSRELDTFRKKLRNMKKSTLEAFDEVIDERVL